MWTAAADSNRCQPGRKEGKKTNGTNGRRLFKLDGDIPVKGLVTINRIEDWWW
jgi:hypothetical protein